jgi:hypothetical protein
MVVHRGHAFGVPARIALGRFPSARRVKTEYHRRRR